MIYSSFILFLTDLWIGFVSCTVYHIVPSLNHSCPVESCLTLSSFAATARHLDSNTLLIFQPGNHTYDSRVSINITNVANFSMTSNSTKRSNVGIVCGSYVWSGLMFEAFAIDYVHISYLKFFGCKPVTGIFQRFSALIRVVRSNLILLGCVFEDHNDITSLISVTDYSNITIAQCTFRNNHVDNSSQEAILFSYCNVNVMIVNSTFIYNEGWLVVVETAIARQNTLTITGSEFKNNSYFPEAWYTNNVTLIHAEKCNTTITDTIFINNGATVRHHRYKAILHVNRSDVLITDTKFIQTDRASYYFLFALRSVLSIYKSAFKHNHGSAIYLKECTVDILDSVCDNNNNDNNWKSEYGGALTLHNTVIRIHGSEFKSNVAKFNYTGGAISCSGRSRISFSETCTLTYNHAERGGAIYLDRSVQGFIAHGATVIIANNTASEGGGIYLDQHANLTLHNHSILQIHENRATGNGGGIYASKSSSINFALKSLKGAGDQTSNSIISFNKNQASKGGGLYLGFNSTVCTLKCLSNVINFDENSAEYGGAVYVVGKLDTSANYPECFFQPLRIPHPVSTYNISNDIKRCSKQDEFPFQFSLNNANYSGISLFKNVFDNCTMHGREFEEFVILKSISNVQTLDIGSSLVQVCHCENGSPNCIKEIPSIVVDSGRKFTIEVAIADRGNHIVNGSIQSEIRGGHGSVLIRDDQRVQQAANGCTPLTFNIFSSQLSQQLIMLPVQLDEDREYIISTVNSEKSIHLIFLACRGCPVGFQKIVDDVKGCECICDVMLKSYIISCNYTTRTIIKKRTTAWIAYLSIDNISDYLIYPYCPMDYCLPPDSSVEINLNIQNGADAQCAHDRSGLLCGTCSPGLSLSLGSSRCLPCHAHWPGVLVSIIISNVLAGIVLVASILMLNLTVAVGTLNGLIYYANIVATNQDKFFPSTSFITVFVSWLNLEFGIDTCFFDGMDFYWKTWIELAFPTYILLLVVLVIIISECSVKFAQIVGKRNPLATLDTLILLCYVKFVRTVILAFSFATLDYPDNSHPVVWWPDATVGYFSGKHIVLWIVAVLIFVAGLFYTVLLFSWQWLLYYQHKMIFKWVQSQRLRIFVEPYHAPYAFKHRYWTGLLLLVRVFVLIISAANVSGDRGITILAIGLTVIILLVLVSCRPYKSWPVEFLEIICYANIIGLCLATLYVAKVGNSQGVVGYISGTITLVLFLIVLTYHVVTQLFLKTQLGKKVKNRLNRQFNDAENEDQISLVTHDNEESKPATYSEVDPPPRRDAVPLSYFVNLRNTTDSVLGSGGCEENELRLREQAINGPTATPYSLMK